MPARINVEPVWWSSFRRNRLIELLHGNTRLADGTMLQMWAEAQNHCTLEIGTIPLSRFLCLADSELLFECDLAVLIQANTKQTPSKAKQTIADAKQDEALMSTCQVYVRGTTEHHGWLVKRRLSGSQGGQKSIKRVRDARGRLQANTKQTEAKPSKDKQTQPSYSYSYSNKKNTYKGSPEPATELEALYEAYPTRKGTQRKKQGIVVIDRLVAAGRLEDVRKAISNYSAHCDAEGKTGTEWVMQFKTFISGPWEEWITPPNGSAHPTENMTPEEQVKNGWVVIP